MFRVIQFECKKMFMQNELWIVLFICSLIALIGYFEAVLSPFNNVNTLETINSATEVSMIGGSGLGLMTVLALVPLLATIPCATSFYDECSNFSINIIATRSTRRKYHFGKIVVIVITAFVVSVLPFSLNLLFCLIAFPMQGFRVQEFQGISSGRYGGSLNLQPLHSVLFPNLYLNMPILNAVLHIFGVGLFGVSMALLSYAMTLIYRKYKIIAIAFSCIISTLSVLVFSSLNLQALVLQDYFILRPIFKDIQLCTPLIELIALFTLSFSVVLIKLHKCKDVIA